MTVERRYALIGHTHDGAVGGGVSAYFGETAPPEGSGYSFWWNTNRGLLFVKYDDGTSVQWVAASPQGGGGGSSGSTPPPSGGGGSGVIDGGTPSTVFVVDDPNIDCGGVT